MVQVDDEDDDSDAQDDRRVRRRKKGPRGIQYYDDDDYHNSRPRPARGFGMGKVGMLLVSISLWLYLATYASLSLFLLGAWAFRFVILNGLMLPLGLLGLASWIVGLVGLSFCIAGPARARGLAILATVVASVHLILVFVVAQDKTFYPLSTPSLREVSRYNRIANYHDLSKRIQNEKNPDRRQELEKQQSRMWWKGVEYKFVGYSPDEEMRWADIATVCPSADKLIALLVYDSKDISKILLPLLSGLVEVARLVVMILLIGYVASAAKQEVLEQKSLLSNCAVGGATILSMIVMLIVCLILFETKSSKAPMGDTPKLGIVNWLVAGELLCYLLHTASLILPAIVALSVSLACGRRR
ncbi:MAG: hypothetical protein RMJ56_08960 [Gemmataceae bacterium]|nr:hypothetical protein [Gemmata sp.]MDW8197716.1 hypothetical protein [Gemmataceae bacterium]